MAEMTNFLIGIIVLLIGIPVGNYLAKITKEELISGQRWFKLIVLLSLAGVLISLIARNDAFLFSFAFIAIVTSRSLKSGSKSSRNKD